MPREGEQRKAEVNVNEDHVADCSEDEEKDSCSEAGRTVDERYLEKIKTAPRPTTKRKARSLKLFNSYRDEFPSFAAISAPLRDLICKGQPNKIKWGENFSNFAGASVEGLCFEFADYLRRMMD